eukprot:m.66264 g.66264  ORF g.66264 m.66264 type:complete len:564 (+) comp8185_c2_seq1:65-1756(+)
MMAGYLFIPVALVAAMLFVGSVMAVTGNEMSVWPPLKSMACTDAPGAGVPFSSTFSISSSSSSSVLANAMARYESAIIALIPREDKVESSGAILSVNIVINTPSNGSPNAYQMSMEKGVVTITATDVVGAIFGMETMLQISQTGFFPCSEITISDEPDFNYRGVSIDVASRYFSINLLQDIIDAISSLKMNYLVLHISDLGAFRVQTSIADVTSHNNGVYPKHAISDLITYASERGVSLVPEFSFPLRASGLNQVNSDDDRVFFCETHSYMTNGQALNNDSSTLAVLDSIVDDMVDLFGTDMFFVGGSGVTQPFGNCTVDSLEYVLLHVVNRFVSKKANVGVWSDAAGVKGLPSTSVMRVAPADKAVAGFPVLLSGGRGDNQLLPSLPLIDQSPDAINAYVDYASKNATAGVIAALFTNVMCMNQPCGTNSSTVPAASGFANRTQDVVVRDAVLSSLFPRISYMAGAAWYFDKSLTPTNVSTHVEFHTSYLISKGLPVCNASCAGKCSLTNDCGQPYPVYKEHITLFEGGFIFGTTVATVFGISVLTILVLRKARSRKGYSEI